jgi:hypothetical protein
MWPRMTLRNPAGSHYSGKSHEGAQVILVGAPGLHTVQVGEPLRFR